MGMIGDLSECFHYFKRFSVLLQRLQGKSNFTVKFKSSVMYAMSSDEISN